MAVTEPFALGGRRALITGAASGIGAAIARALAAHGAGIVAADRDPEGLETLAATLAGNCEGRVYDQADLASIEALCTEAGDIDILVNNAGIALRQPILDLDWAGLRRLIDINLVGPIAFTRLIGAAMVARRRGTIINIGSQMAFTGARDRAVYAATKAAITQFTRTTAAEFGPFGVTANCIAPGRTVTPLNRELLADPAEYEAGLRHIPLRRYGEPRDIAGAALFLASPLAAYITGHTLVVDGGWILD